jgi:hypothetical protein
MKMEIANRQRKNAIGFFFEQIIEIMLPVHMRYLLWAAQKSIFCMKTFCIYEKKLEKDVFRNQAKDQQVPKSEM